MRKDRDVRIGTFQVGTVPALGRIVLDGKNTAVQLSASEFFGFTKREEARIHGTLADHEKITLVDCIGPSAAGTTSTPNGRSFHASVFPHYIVTGTTHIEPEEQCVTAIEIVIENAHTLFWDHEVFGLAVASSTAKTIINQLSAEAGATPAIGEFPHLFYFTGKTSILSAETRLGRLVVCHRPKFTLPTPRGFKVANSIPMRLEFDRSLTFHEVFERANSILVFIDLLIGTKHRIRSCTIEVAGEPEQRLSVYQSMAARAAGVETGRPHPGDVLINGATQPQPFSATLAAWLERQPEWRIARFHFIQNFRKGNKYTVERLVAAANHFDILPERAIGSAPQVSEQLAAAATLARKIFKDLPPSLERDSVLGVLGRVGTRNLRAKVMHRAAFISERIASRFPDMDLVIAAAISARNFFVHGSQAKLLPDSCYELSPFLTDTLEFIFGASDLVEAGWDIKRWSEAGSSLSHPYGRYRVTYAENLIQLKAKLQPPLV